MSCPQSGVTAFDEGVAVAESIRQGAVASATTQAAAIAAEVTFNNSVKALALTNSISPSVYSQCLRQLGQQ